MPKALTLQEKVERAEAKIQEAKESTHAVERPQGRTKRGSFNGTEGKLSVDCKRLIEAGYHPHILNDIPGRIDQAVANGYEFVSPSEVDGIGTNVISRNTDLGDKVRFLVGSTERGEALYAYLMKIKKEWWDEDQAILQGRNDKIDDAIRKGKTP